VTLPLSQLGQMIRREQSVHPMKPKGCNGWWNATERALLHGAARCPIHDHPECTCAASRNSDAECVCAEVEAAAPYVELIVPGMFWWDHEDRECVKHPHNAEQLKRAVRVHLHPDDAADLASDAVYYLDMAREGYAGLASSARATIRAMHRQGWCPEDLPAAFRPDWERVNEGRALGTLKLVPAVQGPVTQ